MCKQWGHIRRKCREQNPKCKFCSKEHESKECPEPKGNVAILGRRKPNGINQKFKKAIRKLVPLLLEYFMKKLATSR